FTTTSFTASWTAPSGSVDSYRLDVATTNSFTGAYVSGFQDLTVSGTSQAVTGLTAGATYYVRVRAVNAAGTGASSSPVFSTVTISPAPAVSAASSVTSSGFTANWSVAAGATKYRLDVSVDPNFGSF